MSNARPREPELPLPRYDRRSDYHADLSHPKHQMAECMKRSCPTAIGLPEPKIAGYREELRDHGNLYVQTMQAMGRNISGGKLITKDISPVAALAVRGGMRKHLIQRFWRSLGAA